MDLWNTFKNVLKKSGRAVIIVEEGKPQHVILDFDEYDDLIRTREINSSIEKNVLEANLEVEKIVSQSEGEEKQVSTLLELEEELPY